MTKIYGVTGLPCAGKSMAAQLMADGIGTGAPGALIKADDVGHQILETPPVVDQLVRRFGSDVADAADAQARRRAIAKKAFSCPADLAWLESVVHPLVFAHAEKIIQANTDKPVILEAALLFTGGLDKLCGTIVLVEANLDIRMVRAAARGWKSDELARREQRQLPLYSHRILASRADKLVRVRNDEDDGHLADRLRDALEKHTLKKHV